MARYVRLKPNEQAAVNRLKEVLTRDFGLARLVLFGSKARGDSHRESDIDVIIVLRDEFDWRVKHAIFDICFDISLEHDVLLQPVVFSLADYDKPVTRATPLLLAVEEEGVPV
ncbi:MAG: nucleotidyltransferase domain-containing protein [bacterium]